MRKNLIPKDEADNPEEDYITLDLQIIQRYTIVKSANVHDFNLDSSVARATEAHAKTDNAKLFNLAKTAFYETSVWVHTKPSQRSHDGYQVLKLIWCNQLGVHDLDVCNTKNYKDIRTLAYHREKKRKNW